MKKAQKIYEDVLNIGIEKVAEEQYKWLKNTNGIGMVIMSLAFIYLIAFFLSGAGNLILLPVWAFLTSILVFVLNFYGFNLLNRHLLFYCIFICAVVSGMYLGEKSGFQNVFILLATFPLIIFPSKQTINWLPGVVLSAVFMILFKTGFFIQHQIISDASAQMFSYLTSGTLFVWVVIFFAKFAFTNDKINGELITKVGGMLKERQLLQNKYRHLSKKHTGITEDLIKLETENLILGNELKQYMDSVGNILDKSQNKGDNTLSNDLKQLLSNMKENSDWSDKSPLEHINSRYIVEDIITNIKRSNIKPDCKFELLNLPVVEARWEDFKVVMVNLIHDAIKRAELSNEGVVTVDCIEEIDEYKFVVADNRTIIQNNNNMVGVEVDEVSSIYLKPENTAVCKRIVKNYNGNLWLDYNENSGHTVYFTIAKQGII